jgi:hypothetical protein
MDDALAEERVDGGDVGLVTLAPALPTRVGHDVQV